MWVTFDSFKPIWWLPMSWQDRKRPVILPMGTQRCFARYQSKRMGLYMVFANTTYTREGTFMWEPIGYDSFRTVLIYLLDRQTDKTIFLIGFCAELAWQPIQFLAIWKQEPESIGSYIGTLFYSVSSSSPSATSFKCRRYWANCAIRLDLLCSNRL